MYGMHFYNFTEVSHIFYFSPSFAEDPSVITSDPISFQPSTTSESAPDAAFWMLVKSAFWADYAVKTFVKKSKKYPHTLLNPRNKIRLEKIIR